MSDKTPKSAGLTYAPEYDESQELDPSKVKPVEQPFEMKQLEYFREQDGKRTFIARVVLLGSIVLMLGASLYQNQRMHDDVLTNLNQTRLDIVALNDQVLHQVQVIEERLVSLEAKVVEGHREEVANLD